MWYYGGRIRIEPDWNVKQGHYTPQQSYHFIRIEPDWNVKEILILKGCKCIRIRIEPDWNVKIIYTTFLIY